MTIIKCNNERASEIHFQGVEAADMAVDAEHDAAVVDEDVVDLAGAGRRVWPLRAK